jgi:hypothetical protein
MAMIATLAPTGHSLGGRVGRSKTEDRTGRQLPHPRLANGRFSHPGRVGFVVWLSTGGKLDSQRFRLII